MLEFANACIAQAKSTIADVIESMDASASGDLSAEDEVKIATVVMSPQDVLGVCSRLFSITMCVCLF